MPTGWNSTSLSRLRQIKEKLLGKLSIDFLTFSCLQDMWLKANPLLNAHAEHHRPACSSKCACWKRGCFSVGLRQPLAATGQLPGVLRLSQNWMDPDFSINKLLSQGVKKMCVVEGRELDYWVGRINIMEGWKLYRLYEFIAINNSLLETLFHLWFLADLAQWFGACLRLHYKLK